MAKTAKPEPERMSEVEHAIPAPPTGRHLTARDALVCVGVCVLLLLAFEGRSIERSGDEMKAGWERTLVLAVGRPAGAVSRATGLGDVKDRLLAWAHPDDGLGGPGGFTEAANSAPAGVPPVTPDAFDPRALGARPRAPRPLRTVLVTGDSLSQPLDARVARAFARAGTGVTVVRDAHLGTGVSQSDIVDWGRLSVQQVRTRTPDAVVMFMGANEGFPMRAGGRTLNCCGPAWTAEYGSRVRRMMNTYRQSGAARVYWLNLPVPRDHGRQVISRSVNQAIAVAAEPYRAQVRVLDMAALFTPGGRYRDSMTVGGRASLVRQADGIHLNGTGAGVALGPVLAALRADFGARVPR
jgi:lysophospholipase L1-like esterase